MKLLKIDLKTHKNCILVDDSTTNTSVKQGSLPNHAAFVSRSARSSFEEAGPA